MVFLLWLYLLFAPKFITYASVGPRFIPSNVNGQATKPLVLLVRSTIDCRSIGVSIDGPTSRTSILVPEPDVTLRAEYPKLTAGHYNVYVACLAADETILQLVAAGSADVVG